jgi:putative hydrolase of the HAD superfamily
MLLQVSVHPASQRLTVVVPHPKIKNIIFDLGGVLIHFYPHQLIKDLFKDEKDLPHNFLEVCVTSEWLDMDRGMLTPTQVAQKVADRFPEHLVLRFIDGIIDTLTLLPDGLKILHEAKKSGYHVYILSNMSEIGFNKLNKDPSFHDFISLFDGAIFSYQVQEIKPEPKIYQTLLKRYGLKPEESLFIDDLKENIIAAKNLGITGIICKQHHEVVQELQKLGVFTEGFVL